MKQKRLIILLITAIFILLAGCSFKAQKITIQKRIGDEETFEDYREVTDKNKVNEALEIIGYAPWQEEEVKMDRLPDYQFQFPRAKENNKIASYSLWVSDDNILEIITDGGKYAKLDKEASSKLYAILIED